MIFVTIQKSCCNFYKNLRNFNGIFQAFRDFLIALTIFQMFFLPKSQQFSRYFYILMFFFGIVFTTCLPIFVQISAFLTNSRQFSQFFAVSNIGSWFSDPFFTITMIISEFFTIWVGVLFHLEGAYLITIKIARHHNQLIKRKRCRREARLCFQIKVKWWR